MDDDRRAAWLARIAQCDEVLAAERESPDPVAVRRVADALWAKASALDKLGRYEECLGVWDEIILRFAHDPPAGRPLTGARALLNKGTHLSRVGRNEAAVDAFDALVENAQRDEPTTELRVLVARALSMKSRVLAQDKRVQDARAVDAEIVRRFADAPEPDLRPAVAFAVTRQMMWLLGAGRVDEAIALSDELLARLTGQGAPEAPAELAQALLLHIRSLLEMGPVRWQTAALDALSTALSAGAEALAAAARHLGLNGPVAAVTRPPRTALGVGLHALAGAIVPAHVAHRRVRGAQAVKTSAVLAELLGDAADPQLQAMAAAGLVYRAIALIAAGRVGEGFRAFEGLVKGGQQAVITALGTLAEQARSKGGHLGELGTIALLSQRAQALGQGDGRIARVAYDESLRAQQQSRRTHRHASPSSSHVGKWMARFLRPSAAARTGS